MTNCILAAPDFIMADPRFATVTFSGGSWSTSLPLSNLLHPKFAFVARSNDTQATSTRFWTDLGTVRDVLVAAIPRCNGSRACRLRLRAFAAPDEGSTVLADTGWQDLYPEIYPVDALYWGHPSLYDGKMSDEDAALLPMPWSYVFDTPVIARHWLLEIDDAGNASGYFEMPRIVLAPGWQATMNFSYGASLGIEDATQVQTSLGMAEFFDQRKKRRTSRFTFDHLPDDEALMWVLDMQQRLGISGQLMFIWDPNDTLHRHRRSFLARIRNLSPLEAAAFGTTRATFELIEIVA